MNHQSKSLPLIVLLVVALLGSAVAAMAQCPMGGGGSGCGGGGPKCVLSTPPAATPLVLVSRTAALYSGEVNVSLTETLGGVKLMAKITDRSGQPDPNSSVSVYGTGHFGSRGLKLARVSAGVFAGMANLGNLDELAVRVHRPGTSQVVYVGIPGRHLGGRCGGQCGGGQCGAKVCPCGEGCKCASGDHSNCKCGAECKCGQACKANADGTCSGMTDGKCAKSGECKAKAGNCPMHGNCPLHRAGQGQCGGGKAGSGCGGGCKQQPAQQ